MDTPVSSLSARETTSSFEPMLLDKMKVGIPIPMKMRLAKHVSLVSMAYP